MNTELHSNIQFPSKQNIYEFTHLLLILIPRVTCVTSNENKQKQFTCIMCYSVLDYYTLFDEFVSLITFIHIFSMVKNIWIL